MFYEFTTHANFWSSHKCHLILFIPLLFHQHYVIEIYLEYFTLTCPWWVFYTISLHHYEQRGNEHSCTFPLFTCVRFSLDWGPRCGILGGWLKYIFIHQVNSLELSAYTSNIQLLPFCQSIATVNGVKHLSLANCQNSMGDKSPDLGANLLVFKSWLYYLLVTWLWPYFLSLEGNSTQLMKFLMGLCVFTHVKFKNKVWLGPSKAFGTMNG
jgi:hypothetical protein